MTRFVCVLIICLVFLINSVRSEVLCSEEFCKSYLEKESCRELPEACTIQNTTYNGIFLPASVPCNCCKFCLQNLDKGEKCTIGDPSSPPPTSICGHGLSCTSTDQALTCQKMNSSCINAQVTFDENVETGNIGYLETRPYCDRNGLYQVFHCVPGEICYCLDENGERIFGEVPFTSSPYFALKCQCSRNYYKFKQNNDKNVNNFEHFRCQANGDYDTIQCIEDKCLCVDADNGYLTYPNLEPVNVTMIADSTLPCFNNKTHLEAEYLRDCERIYFDMLNETAHYEEGNIEKLGQIMPNCQLDGNFAPVQETFSTKFCTDPSGNRLENFEVLKTNPLSSTMNCNCARVRSILSGYERPECCENGNYKQIQTRRGMCRCVDKNGNQVGKEVDCHQMEQLQCFNNTCVS